jgi:hypothetical protein
MNIRLVGVEFLRTDGNDEGNNRFSVLYERAYQRLVNSSICDRAHSSPLPRFVLHKFPMYSLVFFTETPLFFFVLR